MTDKTRVAEAAIVLAKTLDLMAPESPSEVYTDEGMTTWAMGVTNKMLAAAGIPDLLDLHEVVLSERESHLTYIDELRAEIGQLRLTRDTAVEAMKSHRALIAAQDALLVEWIAGHGCPNVVDHRLCGACLWCRTMATLSEPSVAEVAS